MPSGQFSAIVSAILFGVSPVLCKLVIGDMSPLLLAGLLYLGSGLGLLLVLIWQRRNPLGDLARLSRHHRTKLLGAIVAGGMIAPVCLTYGIKYGTAAEISLLLNLETVATTLLAWLFFREHVGGTVWLGKALILVAAALIVITGGETLRLSSSGLLVVLACVFWGIDNNLTRDVDELPPAVLAGVKGLSAGTFNIFLSIVMTPGTVGGSQVAGGLLIGALSYGASLVLFVQALRGIGSARTSTFFAAGPFVGMLLAVLLLGEHPPLIYWPAMALMLGGIALLCREAHGHYHEHDELAHAHTHAHDEHHLHEHDDEPGPEPHDHPHFHVPLAHHHVHWPDIHHRHGHGK